MSMSVDINDEDKIIYVKVTGFPSPIKTSQCIELYRESMVKIDAEEYSLLIDCLKMALFKDSSIPVLKELFKMYARTGFRHIVFVIPKVVMSYIQIKRVESNVPELNVTYVKSVEEGIKICKE